MAARLGVEVGEQRSSMAAALKTLLLLHRSRRSPNLIYGRRGPAVDEGTEWQAVVHNERRPQGSAVDLRVPSRYTLTTIKEIAWQIDIQPGCFFLNGCRSTLLQNTLFLVSVFTAV